MGERGSQDVLLYCVLAPKVATVLLIPVVIGAGPKFTLQRRQAKDFDLKMFVPS